MKTKGELKCKIESFSDLEKGWGGYNEGKITTQSIVTASRIIDSLPDNTIQEIDVFPMRDGGVQIEVGEYKEIEILNTNATVVMYDINLNQISKTKFGENNALFHGKDLLNAMILNQNMFLEVETRKNAVPPIKGELTKGKVKWRGLKMIHRNNRTDGSTEVWVEQRGKRITPVIKNQVVIVNQ